MEFEYKEQDRIKSFCKQKTSDLAYGKYSYDKARS